MLIVDVKNNVVHIGAVHQHTFARNWTAAVFELLLRNGGNGATVSAALINRELAVLGQKQSLTRAQLLRVIDALKLFIGNYFVTTLAITHQPRQASVGPWQLRFLSALAWSVQNELAPTTAREIASLFSWPYPRLFTGSAPSSEALVSLLSQCLTSDGFAATGNLAEALACVSVDDAACFSAEGIASFALRRLRLLRRSGAYAEARTLAQQLSSGAACALDARAQSYATFLLARISYDENPGVAWRALDMHKTSPINLQAPCAQTSAEWHNLQGLVTRRKILDLAQNADAHEQNDDHTAALQALHGTALLHFESALYMALSLQHGDSLHSYIDNIALHMQQMLPLKLSTIDQVCDWYALGLAAGEKLGSGQHDAQDLLFFGEFWLDNELEIKAHQAGSNKYIMSQRALDPSTAAYWQHTIAAQQASGNPRQIATALLLHFRWTLKHASTKQQQAAAAKLQAHLAQYPKLGDVLTADGYGFWCRLIG